jgi:hypothetical protein
LYFLILFLILLVRPLDCFSQEILLDVWQTGPKINISARLGSAPYEEVFTSLQDGLEAEIIFQFRLYQNVRGLFSIFGDRLIAERQTSYRAHMNFYDNTYSLNTSNGKKLDFKGRDEFIEDFFRIDLYTISGFALEQDKEYYLRARIRLNHVKLVPPLNLIYIFKPIGITTEWKEVRIGSGRGELN